MRARSRRVMSSTLKGAVAGLIGTFVMTQFQKQWNSIAEAIDPKPRRSAEDPSTVKVAQALSHAVTGVPIVDKAAKKVAGQAVHYAFGTAMGAAYGALAEIDPRVTMGLGMGYAAGLWLLADEIAVPALGLSKPAGEAPISSHIHGLAAHLVFGGATEGVRRLMDRS